MTTEPTPARHKGRPRNPAIERTRVVPFRLPESVHAAAVAAARARGMSLARWVREVVREVVEATPPPAA